MSRSRWLPAAAGFAVSAVAVVGILIWALQQEPPELPSSGRSLTWLLAALGLYALNTMVRAERWHRLVVKGGGTPARADTYSLTVVCYAGNNLLPARLGDVFRIVLLRPRGGGSRREITGTLVAERVLDVAVLVVMFSAVALWGLDRVEVPALGSAALVAVVFVVFVALVVAVVGWFRRDLVVRGARYLRPVGNATLGLRGPHGAEMLAFTVLIWGIEAAVWGSAAAAAGLYVNAFEAAYLVSLASLFSMIPSGPGYVGTQDSAALLAAKTVGASSSVALSFLVIARFVLLVPITVTGILLLAFRYHALGLLRSPQVRASA